MSGLLSHFAAMLIFQLLFENPRQKARPGQKSALLNFSYCRALGHAHTQYSFIIKYFIDLCFKGFMNQLSIIE